MLYPFFFFFCIMWQTGTITPAQEHFISNLVRQKIIVAIDSIVSSDHPQAKTFMLFLPEKELHEIGLLFMNYCIKKRGHKAIFLGSMLPLDSLIKALKIKHPDYLVTTTSSPIEAHPASKYLTELSKNFRGDKIILSTNIYNQQPKFPDSIKIVQSITEFISEIEEIALPLNLF